MANVSKEQLLDQVATTRRRFLKRIGGGALLLAIPASTIVNAAPQDDQGKDGKGKAKGKGGKGKGGKGKGGKGKGDGKGDGKGKGDN
jgi:hypothetical protein